MITAPDITLEEVFEMFRVAFPYTRVKVHFDSMTYKITHKKFAESIAREAKQLIIEKQLPLQVEIRRGAIDATILITENKKA